MKSGGVISAIVNRIPAPINHIPTSFYLAAKGVKVKGFGSLAGIIWSSEGLTLRIRSGPDTVIGKRVEVKAPLTMEDHVLIGDEVVIRGGPVFIGRHSNIHFKTEIRGEVSIGRYCAVARRCTFQSRNHETNRPSMLGKMYLKNWGKRIPAVTKGGINVGNDVWIGTSVIILPGVNIGDGAIIGAGSVVTRDVEPYSVAGGVPAARKKYRFPEHVREQLLKIRWWEWDNDRILRNHTFFHTDLNDVDDLFSIIVD